MIVRHTFTACEGRTSWLGSLSWLGSQVVTISHNCMHACSLSALVAVLVGHAACSAAELEP